LPEPSFHKGPGLSFIELESIDSTNNYALAQLHAGLTHHGLAYFARQQSAGKGQRGKTWMAEKDSSIILTVVIDPHPLSLTQQFELSACTAVSVCDFFKKYAGDNVHIKWPNDLYWQDRKAAGILIENIIGGRPEARSQKSEIGVHKSKVAEAGSAVSVWRWAVIGVGINLNQTYFPAELKNPVSLKQITGNDYNPAELAKELHQAICDNFRRLVTSGFDGFYSSYLQLLYKKGEIVKLKKGNRVFEAMIKSVSPNGKLIVQHAIEEEYDFGEIEWLIPTAIQEK
jgi:BirA family transcriptional regulator, biotin operon repressor / biotin---[acetyl-CoA-carboxylase] ligase